MYTINLATGVVIRSSDNKQVAPGQSVDDPDYLEYVAWVGAGNAPTETNIPVMQSSKITRFAFRSRFTANEKAALEFAMIDDPSASQQQRQIAAMLRVFVKDLDNAQFVVLDHPDIVQGVQMLVQLGVLTADRATEILTNPVQPEELAS